MKCEVCAAGVRRPELIRYNLSVGDRLILIEHVPAEVCDRCSEITLSPGVVDKLQQTIWLQGPPARVIDTPVYEFEVLSNLDTPDNPQPTNFIFVLGCPHGLQWPPYPCCCEDWMAQIEKYRQELEVLASRYRFDIYCEEIDHRTFSNAEHHAIKHGKRYVNIDMPIDTRKTLGIPAGYWEPGAPHSKEEIDGWHHAREDYMFNRVSERMGPATRALVVCGYEHMEALVERFRAGGAAWTAAVDSANIMSKDWFNAAAGTMK